MAKVSLIRHGDAQYKNTSPHYGFDAPNDLREDGIAKLQAQAKAFAESIDPTDIVTVWSSPIPRSIETANVFKEALEARGIAIRKEAIFDALEEVRSFRWEYLKNLVDGGEITVDGVAHPIDKSITNPKGLTYGQYFFESGWLNVPQEYIESLGACGQTIRAIESYESVVGRITRTLDKLANKEIADNHHILMFTHQCNTDFVIQHLNEYAKGGIATGTHVTLEKRENDFDVKMFPDYVGTAERVGGVLTATKERMEKAVAERAPEKAE